MFKWLWKKSGIRELSERLSALEGRVDNLEGEVTRGMRRLGRYKDRTDEELRLMKKQVTDLLLSVDALVSTQENREGVDRARQLKRRLKNNLTRITNTLKRGER